MFRSRLRFALPALLLAAPLTAADPPKPLLIETDGHGRVRLEMLCHDTATDVRLALLDRNPRIEVARLAGDADFTDAGLAHVAKLPNLRELTVVGDAITDRGLKHLAGHPALRDLLLRELPITRAGAEAVAAIPHLTSLTLKHQKVEPAALKVLAGIKSLKVLRLFNEELTDADLSAARGFAGLETLDLGGKQFTPAALAMLVDPKTLRDLTLTNQTLTGDGAKPLAGLVRLDRLTLYDTPATPAAYDVVRALPLRSLTVAGPRADADLEPLARFGRLSVLHLHNTQITREKTSALRAALPRTAVSPHGWRHTTADLKAMSRDLETAADGTVIAVEMLCHQPATDEKLAILHQFSGIKTLTAFGGPALTDAGLANLKSLPKLEELDIGSSELTDAGLKHLAGCKALRVVRVTAGHVTEAGLAELRRALPRATVERE